MMQSFQNFPWGILVLFALIELFLKSIALWRSARNGQKYWFVALLVINSVGILPAIYLISNPEKKAKKSTRK